jgi:hypothetical protein
LRVKIKVHARARRSRLAGQVGEEWKLEVAAPPVEGKANRAVVEFLARSLGLPRSAVRIVAGERSSHKLIEIDGVTEQQFAELMNHKDPKGAKDHKETPL